MQFSDGISSRRAYVQQLNVDVAPFIQSHLRGLDPRDSQIRFVKQKSDNVSFSSFKVDDSAVTGLRKL
jgi:hypothetical protein